jgi:hypothetical protein
MAGTRKSIMKHLACAQLRSSLHENAPRPRNALGLCESFSIHLCIGIQPAPITVVDQDAMKYERIFPRGGPQES